MAKKSSNTSNPQKLSNPHTFEVSPQSAVSIQNLTIPNQRPAFRTISPQAFRGKDTKLKPKPQTSNSQPVILGPSNENKIRFTNPKTTERFTHRQEKSDEPPRKRIRHSKYPKDTTKPTFSIRKPVGAAISTDAWALILERCDVRFLIAARLVCRSFHEILSKETIWRKVRETTYPNRPDCPPGLSEMQYANLLSERGCQIPQCTRENTRKVYWPFLLRMCEQCFILKTQMIEPYGDEEIMFHTMYFQQPPNKHGQSPDKLGALLPSGVAWSGRYSGPRRLNPTGRDWMWSSAKVCVLTSAYENLKREFVRVKDDQDFDISAWAKSKWDVTVEIMKAASILETIPDESSSLNGLRKQKIAFFTQKAAELSPPMRFEILDRMAAYHGAIETSNKASLRSWDVLRSKIDRPELRVQAERLIKWDNHSGIPDFTRGLDNVWDQLIAHREGRLESPKRYSVEQKVVIDIARQEFPKFIDKVHDEDVLLLFLDSVRRTYEQLDIKPYGFNGDGTKGIYRLTLDDTRMVIHDALVTHELRGTMRERAIFSSLKCIACWRPDYNKCFGFEELIRHIERVHCRFVGVDLHYHRLAAPLDVLPISSTRYMDPVPWLHIDWPKSFPAIPRHRKAEPGMFWNPDEEVNYVRHPEEILSIFEKYVVREDAKYDTSNLDVGVCEAIKVLADTRLEAPAMVKIALEYAAQRATNRGFDPNMKVYSFQQLETRVHEISPALKFRFMCGICLKDFQSNTLHARFTRHPAALDRLVDHWKRKHDIEDGASVKDLLHLPSDGELWRIMQEEDARLSLEKTKIIAKGGSDDQNQLDPRTRALLKIPTNMERFYQLFKQKDDCDEIRQRSRMNREIV